MPMLKLHDPTMFRCTILLRDNFNFTEISMLYSGNSRNKMRVVGILHCLQGFIYNLAWTAIVVLVVWDCVETPSAVFLDVKCWILSEMITIRIKFMHLFRKEC